MATSGTVATTTIDTATLIEHAYRRVGKPASAQTPEGIFISKECLYLLLLSLANRGFNLWCTEQNYMGLAASQATYVTPPGTIDVMNVVYSQVSQAVPLVANVVTSNSTMTTLTEAVLILRVGLKFSSISASDTIVISSSDDNVTYTSRYTLTRADFVVNTWYWLQLDPTVTAQYWKVSTTSASVASTFYLAPTVYDLPIQQWNRDDFMALNNKRQTGRPSTNYMFEKLITPQITLWPVPNNSNDHITIYRHRQIQDIGTLTDTIDIPERWKDAIVWQLARKLCFELPDVDPNRIQMVLSEANNNLIEAEGNETDGAPIYFSTSIGCYTR